LYNNTGFKCSAESSATFTNTSTKQQLQKSATVSEIVTAVKKTASISCWGCRHLVNLCQQKLHPRLTGASSVPAMLQ